MFSKYTKFPNIFFKYKNDKQALAVIIHILDRSMRFQNDSASITTKSFIDELKITKRDFYRVRDLLKKDGIIMVDGSTYLWNIETEKGVSYDTTSSSKGVSNDTTEGCHMIPQSVSYDTTFENHSIYNKKERNSLKKEMNEKSFFDGMSATEKMDLELLNKILENYPTGTEHTQPSNFAKARQNVNIHKKEVKIYFNHILKALENYKKTTDCRDYTLAPNTFLNRWREYQDTEELEKAGKLITDSKKNFASGAASLECPIFGVAVNQYDHNLRSKLKLFVPDLTKKKSVEHFLQVTRQTMAKYIDTGIFKENVHYYMDGNTMVFIPAAIIEFKRSGNIGKRRKTNLEKKNEILEQMGVSVA
jgi:hypothetical protein